MPTVDVVVESNLDLSVRARQVCGMFDCPPAKKQTLHFTGNIAIEDKDWAIGLIVGPSGSGKSTVAKNLWPNEYGHAIEWGNGSVIDDFPDHLSIESISDALSSVGFSTVPAWLRPYGVLSNGEQFRTEIARRMLEQDGVIVVDEFTSVVDRQVAKVACHSVQKFVRRQGKQLVAVTCHHDVEDWLQPDWVYEPSTGEFRWRSVQPRPQISVEVARLDRKAWSIFAPFHYLTAELHPSARCFGLWAEGTLAAFTATLPMPHKTARITRVTRTVCLPDWQGLGLAPKLVEVVASAYKARGRRLRKYPAHPAYIKRGHRKRLWKMTKPPGYKGSYISQRKQIALGSVGGLSTAGRPCATFEYVGPPDDDAAAILLPA